MIWAIFYSYPEELLLLLLDNDELKEPELELELDELELDELKEPELELELELELDELELDELELDELELDELELDELEELELELELDELEELELELDAFFLIPKFSAMNVSRRSAPPAPPSAPVCSSATCRSPPYPITTSPTTGLRKASWPSTCVKFLMPSNGSPQSIAYDGGTTSCAATGSAPGSCIPAAHEPFPKEVDEKLLEL